MIKESKNIDFYTTGKKPTLKEFERISEWIKKNKERISRIKRVVKVRAMANKS